MKRTLLSVLCLVCCCAFAGTSGHLDLRIKSEVSTAGTLGATTDRVDASLASYFLAGTNWGPIDTVYHDERSLGSGASEVLGLVGSLTNSLGEAVSFAAVKGLVVQQQTGTHTLSIVSGLWSGSPASVTVSPYGSFALVGSYPVTATGAADRITISNSATGTSTYLVWIVGTK